VRANLKAYLFLLTSNLNNDKKKPTLVGF